MEEKERLNREPNIIIHGVQECESHGKEEEKKQISKFLAALFTKIGIKVQYKIVMRLGQKENNKTRPIKVVLNSKEDKVQVFSSLKNLKGYDEYKNIRLTHDYTVAERKLIKTKSDEAKSINQTLPDDCGYIMQVWGNPKNGMTLRRKYWKKNNTLPTAQ